MKTFYKYLIFFILGIILSLTLKKKKIIEGLPNQTISEIFRGGSRPKNYITTDNDNIGYYEILQNNCDQGLFIRNLSSLSIDTDDGRLNYEVFPDNLSQGEFTGSRYSRFLPFRSQLCEDKCARDDNCIGFQYYYLNREERSSEKVGVCKYFNLLDDDESPETISDIDGQSTNILFSGINKDSNCMMGRVGSTKTFIKKNSETLQGSELNQSLDNFYSLIGIQNNEILGDTSIYSESNFSRLNSYDNIDAGTSPNPFIRRCPVNQIANVDKTSCECDSNSFLNETRNCIPCPENSTKSEDGTKCICNDNKIMNNSGNCEECPPNSTPNEDHTLCICNGDNDFMNNQNTCETCPQNSETNIPYKTTCICPNNTFFNGTECVELSESINLLEKINNSDSLNRGCANYTCSTNPNTYDNYQKKIPTDDDELYSNCGNFSESEYIHANPDIVPCSNEICCDNKICYNYQDSIDCPPERFLPNKKIQSSDDLDVINQTCCPPMDDSNSEYSNLYNSILEESDKNINEKITGNDIRNYIYNTFFDFGSMLRDDDFINNIGTPQELGVIINSDNPSDYEINNFFYEIFSRKLSELDDSKLQYLRLKSEVITHISSNGINLENINSDKYNINEGDNPTIKIKKLLKNFDKIQKDNNIYYKQLDRFFHGSLNQSKDSHLNLGIFIGLLNQ